MAKILHEIRDPIHTFIRIDQQERAVVDSRPVQRLRHIHHLAMSYMVYPGATHRRFEHSLGVMELAGRVYDIVTDEKNLNHEIKDLFPELRNEDQRRYWRRVLRMAALCHDIGHLPFSHAAESLLPEGLSSHEQLTKLLIESDEMQEIWRSQRPVLVAEDIVKLALGKKEYPEGNFTDWEAILSEIIVGDSFGVDRIDYLLRDSHHAGVAYGRFDHHRLIDTLRILPQPQAGNGEDRSVEPWLGVQEGGIHSTEALILARYFMYSQVYFHPVRKIYDIHLQDFLLEFLPSGKFPHDINELLSYTDNKVLAEMQSIAECSDRGGHFHAVRIMKRKHFKQVYEYNPSDISGGQHVGRRLYDAIEREFGGNNVRCFSKDIAPSKGAEFPVMMRDGRVLSSLQKSQVLNQIPPFKIFNIYSDDPVREKVKEFIEKNLPQIMAEGEEAEDATA